MATKKLTTLCMVRQGGRLLLGMKKRGFAEGGWFNEQDVPFASMWPDDAYWLPIFLANKKFIGTFVYEGYDTILHHTLKEVEGFDNN